MGLKKVFVSHASEDKDSFVLPLVEELEQVYSIGCWLDQNQITAGQSIVDRINDGLEECKYAIIILSSSFFKKDYTRGELLALTSRYIENECTIIPVYHGIDRDHRSIKRNMGILCHILGLDSRIGISRLAAKISKTINTEETPSGTKGFLLPFLPNRLLQDKEIRSSFLGSTSKDRPFVTILPGNLDDAHEMFVHRMAERTLQRIPEYISPGFIKTMYINWPRAISSIDNFDKEFAQQILHQIPECTSYKLDHLNQAIGEMKVPIILATVLEGDALRRFGSKGINAYVKFWMQWPNLLSNQYVFPILLICYRGKNLFFWRTELFLSRQKNNLNAKILPKLSAITLDDALEWNRSEFCAIYPSRLHEAKTFIEEIFRGRRDMSMNCWAEHITHLCSHK